MQDPNADTEWNDALRRHGILPEKKKEAEITEDDLIKMVDDTIKSKSGEKDVNVSCNNNLIVINFSLWKLTFTLSLPKLTNI